jgi:hypothetical protein
MAALKLLLAGVGAMPLLRSSAQNQIGLRQFIRNTALLEISPYI